AEADRFCAVSEILRAIEREIHEASLRGREIERIRFDFAAIPGSLVAFPLSGRRYELILHPTDGMQLMEESEPLLRYSSAEAPFPLNTLQSVFGIQVEALDCS